MEGYLAHIIDSANEGIYVTDTDRRFLLWNKAAERISGYSRSELIGRCCYDNILSHTDGAGRPLCMAGCPLKAAIETGRPSGPEIVWLKHKNGGRIAVEVNVAPIRRADGAILGGVEVFHDVTKRLERERLLRERKEKLETVLDAIGDGILFLDTAGSVSAMNRACARMFGLDADITGSALDALPPDAPLRRALSRVETAFQGTLTGERSGGDAVCQEARRRFRCWTAAIDRAPAAPRSRCYDCGRYRAVRRFLQRPHELTIGDRAVNIVSSFIELRETNELWEVLAFHDAAAEKLDAALKVAGAAAHELRQPMQILIMLAGLMEKEAGGNDKLLSMLDKVVDSCERMDAIIRKMTEITRYRTKEYVDGSDILDLEDSSAKGDRAQ